MDCDWPFPLPSLEPPKRVRAYRARALEVSADKRLRQREANRRCYEKNIERYRKIKREAARRRRNGH